MAVEEQFDAFSAALELTADQKEAIADPFHEGLGALQNLQRLHDMILSELSEEQQQQYVEMVHGMLGASFSAEGHGH